MRYAEVSFRLDRRRLRLCRLTCSGVLGVLTVGHSAYSRGFRPHAPLVLSRVAGPAACCGNKQTRLQRQQQQQQQQQQAMDRCGYKEQPSRCAWLSRSASRPPRNAVCLTANVVPNVRLCPGAVLRYIARVGVRSLDRSNRAHRWLRLAQADDALSAVGGSDLCEAAMRTHPHVRTGLHAFLRASAPPTWTVPRRRTTRCRAACKCGGRHLARRPCTHWQRRTPSRTTRPGRGGPARSQIL
jgi:hypothetical protein